MNTVIFGKMHKRVISLLLAAVLLLSGCGSIILSGNLEFEANPPISTYSGAASDWLGGSTGGATGNTRDAAVSNVRFAYGNMDKYNIDGDRAFLILPGHVSPADVTALNDSISEANTTLKSGEKPIDLYKGEFEVIDCYTDSSTGEERFIYSYYVPYIGDGKEYTDDDYPEVSNTGLSVSRKGNGNGLVTARPEKIADIKGMVFVLMSYAPKSGDYTVFFSKVFTLEESRENDVRMLAGKAAGKPVYYAYANDYLYLYGADGKKDYTSYYAAVVKTKAGDMINTKMNLPFGNLMSLSQQSSGNCMYYKSVAGLGSNYYGNGFYWRYAVADVEMDQNLMPYITLNIEISSKNFEAADQASDDIVNNDEDVEDTEDGAVDGASPETVGDVTYFHGTFACLQIPIGQDGITFYSDISDAALEILTSEAFTSTTETRLYDQEKWIKDNAPAPADSAAGDNITDKAVLRSNTTATVGPPSAGIDMLTEDSGSQNHGSVASAQFESFDETLQRLQRYSTAAYNMDWDYYHSVWDSLHDFSVFETKDSEENGGLYFALAGGETAVTYNNDEEHTPYKYYGTILNEWNMFPGKIEYYSEFYNETVSEMASDANTKGLYIPFLKPGTFGYADNIEINIGDYHSRGWSCSTDGINYFTKHCYPFSQISFRVYDDGSIDLPVVNLANHQLAYGLFHTLAYHRTTYTDGTSDSEYGVIMNRSAEVYPVPYMVVDETMDVTLKRNYILTDGSRSESISEVTQTVTIPIRYRMVYPEGTYLQISGNVWIGNMVKAENELGAITYYTTRGNTLLLDDVYSWRLRQKYPIYDNASGTTIESVSRYDYYGFGWWLNWYFYRSEAFWRFYDENSDKYFSTLQVNKQGVDSIIYDRLVPGEAQDLGVWRVDGKNYVAYFTDQVIRFYEYKEDEKKYRAVAQISLDELQMLSEGYFLREKTDGWVSSVTDMSADNAEEMAELAEDAMNTDEERIALTSDNIIPIGGLSRFLYFSEGGNMYLMSLLNGGADAEPWQKHGRLMPLMDGTYYRVFDTGDSYKVVGFQTANYSYSPADQCMARVYDIDIEKLVQSRADESISMYLDSLRNVYLSDNHTLLKTVTETENGQYSVSYSLVPPDKDDPEYSRAVTLFTGSDSEMLNELDAICREYSVTRSDAMVQKVKELQDRLRTQRMALTEMYDFLGIAFTGIPTSWQYIQYEGWLYNASHGSLIETMMVEMVLSDDYLNPEITPQQSGFDGLIGVHAYDPEKDGTDVRFVDESLTDGELYVDEFAAYRDQYRLWEANARGDVDNMTVLSGDDLSGQLVTAIGSGEYISQITDMDFYEEVLNVIKDTYLRGA